MVLGPGAVSLVDCAVVGTDGTKEVAVPTRDSTSLESAAAYTFVVSPKPAMSLRHDRAAATIDFQSSSEQQKHEAKKEQS